MDRLRYLFYTILPKTLLSHWMGRLAVSPGSRALIPWFVRAFAIDLEEAERPLGSYESLTDFFTRRLKPGRRIADPGAASVISPVDGQVAEFGAIANGTLVQAKGKSYTVSALLGDAQRAERFLDGSYLTIYLSPRDYHRIHSPVDGVVAGASYIPGRLFPVNAFGVRMVDQLFARNERLITYLQGVGGLVAVVKVGATMVGSARVVYDPELRTQRRPARVDHRMLKGPRLHKGDELGWFEFGSTVILLFEPGKVRLRPDLQPGQRVLMGQAIGTMVATRAPSRQGTSEDEASTSPQVDSGETRANKE